MIGSETDNGKGGAPNGNLIKLKEYNQKTFDEERHAGGGVTNPAFLGSQTKVFDGPGNAIGGSTNRGKWRQILAACGAFMGSMSMGAALAWPATALPDLRTSPQFEGVTETQLTWVNSLMTLGAAAGCPLAGYCIDRIGRRLTMLLNTLPFIVGSLLIIFAPDIDYVCAGRFVTGFCVGIYTISAPVFIGEIAEKHIRGGLASGFELLLTVGLLYIYLIGTYASMQIQALAVGLIPIACLCLLLLVPESPRFLLNQRKYEEAMRSLMWYRGVDSSCVVNDEYEEMKHNVEEEVQQKVSSMKELFTKPLMKPLGVAFGLMFFQQLSGIDAVMGYTVDIFKSAEVAFDENWATNILGAVDMTFCAVSSRIVDRYGRKVLLILSGLLQGISLFVFAGFFYAKVNFFAAETLHSISWLPITALILYSAGFSLGFGPVVWILMGEILPPRIKGLAAGSVVTFRWLLGFMVTKLFKDLLKTFGDDGGYLFLGIICCAGCFYIYFAVPETKGKSLDEIQLLFASKESPGNNNETTEKH